MYLLFCTHSGVHMLRPALLPPTLRDFMGVSSKTSRMPVEMFSSIYFIVPLASMRIKFPFSRPHRPKVSQRNAWETCIFEFHTQNSQRASQKRAAWGISAFYCRDIPLIGAQWKVFCPQQFLDTLQIRHQDGHPTDHRIVIGLIGRDPV